MLRTEELRRFFAQQLVLIGTYNNDGTENFATISWVSFTWGASPYLVISMHGDIAAQRNFERTGLLSATIVTPDILPFAEVCGRAELKARLYETARPTISRGRMLDVPIIEGAAWSYECKLHQMVKLEGATTYFAEIKHVSASEEILELDFFDLCTINPVVYAGDNYFAVGKHLGKLGDFSNR